MGKSGIVKEYYDTEELCRNYTGVFEWQYSADIFQAKTYLN